MAKETQTAKAPAANKTQPKPERTPEQTGGELAVAELGYGPLGVTDTPNIQGQAQRLSDPRLHMIQRQMLANQIGRVQGNGHLQQVVTSLKRDELNAPYQPNISTPSLKTNISAPSCFETIKRSSSSGQAPYLQKFEGKEHESLGDSTGVKAIDLGNGVILSWGQIIALAGDYYESSDKLLEDTRTPEGRLRIRAALEYYGSPNAGATSLPVPTQADKDAAGSRLALLAMQNLPHFSGGGTAKETWLHQHSLAISAAIRAGLAKDKTKLNDAYFLEAFGEHFLTDAFSGGHIRTPRKEIIDYYVGTFAPAVINPFIDHLRDRLVNDLYDQVIGGWGYLLYPLFGVGGGLAAKAAIKVYIRSEVNDTLNPALAKIGGQTELIKWFGLAVGGMISGAIHDMEGRQGVKVTSKAHPEVWTAYGDNDLDKSPENRKEVESAIQSAKHDIDTAFDLAQAESTLKESAPQPSTLPTQVYFGFNQDDITPAAATALRGASLYMIYNPNTIVELVGHTDPIGTPSDNMSLGLRRAQSVQSFLGSGGVATSQITISSQGESSLVANDPKQYWRNRRVALIWMQSETSPMSHDIAYEHATEIVRSQVGPPYKAEDFIPEAVEGENPPLPEWKWGSLSPAFQAEVAQWVNHKVQGFVGKITTAPELNDKVVTIEGIDVTIRPRPIVQTVVNEFLEDPMKFLGNAFGEVAGPTDNGGSGSIIDAGAPSGGVP